MLLRYMTRTAILLVSFAVIGTTVLAYVNQQTRDAIASSQRRALLDTLHVLINDDAYDNDLYIDRITIVNKKQLGSKRPLNIYRARKQGQPVAAVIESVAPDGYSGDIKLLIAIDAAGTLLGVRVLEHKETPGLGDKLEIVRSTWITSFNNRSLSQPGKAGWAVKKDGGTFDQFTGATITPRAVVKAVYSTLLFYQQNQQMLFSTPAEAQR